MRVCMESMDRFNPHFFQIMANCKHSPLLVGFGMSFHENFLLLMKIQPFVGTSLHSVERQFEVRDLALARLEGEKERGGEVQVRDLGDIPPEQFW